MTEANPLELTSYMDESGHADDPKIHFAGMAGFVAPREAWSSIGRAWQEALDIFGLKEPFHMKDFAHCTGQFKSWKGYEEKRQLLYNALVTFIVKSHAVPIGAIVSLEGYRSLSENQQLMFKSPYHIAFQTCTRGAAIMAMGLEPPETVSMVYAYNHETGTIPPLQQYSIDQAGNAEKLWRTMKDSTDFGRWMGEYQSSTPADSVQLQAADLLPYELTKEFENLLTRPNDKMRWGLREILRGTSSPFHFVRFLDRKELLRIIKESEWPDQTSTEELELTQEQSAHQKMVEWFLHRTTSE